VFTIREINQFAELDALRADWRRLLLETPGYSFFQTLEWLQTSWGYYPLPQKLRVIVVERGGEVIGIVPFCVRAEARKVGRVRALTYPLNDWGTFYGPIGPEPHLTFRAAIRHIAETPRDWDFIDLRSVDEAAPEFMAIGEGLRAAGFDFITRPRMEVRLCRTADGWDAYLESRSRNWRREMRRNIELLENQGGEVKLLRYRPVATESSTTEAEAGSVSAQSSAHDEIFDVCVEIAERSWQAEAGPAGTLSSSGVRELLRQLHRQAGDLGMLDTNILMVGGRPVAFNYNYLAGGRTYGLRCGFDGTAGLENCGKILLYKMLEDSFRRGDLEYNFGPGRQPYKERFATEMRHAYTFRHYARYSLRSQLLRLKERVSSRFLSEQALIEKSLVS
jgi:CelD/BcsL family acetyltransferase involved in cellulose biosynthesis